MSQSRSLGHVADIRSSHSRSHSHTSGVIPGRFNPIRKPGAYVVTCNGVNGIINSPIHINVKRFAQLIQ